MTTESCGQLLKSSRDQAGRSLASIAKELKINHELLERFEAGQFNFSELDVHQQGYLKNYVQLLGLDWQEVIKKLGGSKAARAGINRTQHRTLRSLVLTQQIRRGALIAAVVVGVGGIIFVATQLFVGPDLTITSPQTTELRSNSRQLEVIGKTSPGSDVLINDTPVAVGLEGEFKQNVLLSSGVNRVEITAINSLSRTATRELVVVVTAKTSN